MTIPASKGEILTNEACKACSVRSVALFKDLDPDVFQKFHASIRDIQIGKGDSLYAIGQAGERVFTIREGIVKLVQYLPDGSQRITRLLKQGDLAGIEATSGSDYQHDAIALTRVESCAIPVTTVEMLASEQPQLHKTLLTKWRDALATSESWLTRLSTGPSRYRVIRLLIWLAENTHEKAFYLPGREDIGHMLALTTETVSRTIADLRRDNYIELVRADYAKADVRKLKAIVKDASD
ncbi:MAG: Crp/Fnr family transcriptional regulator [Gammaproteobacteria bacterium]|jgi:CRP/FNR family transcriptional regulator, anaerobic regulatory protein